MEQKTNGIILRTRRFTETSLIAEWLTPDLGRIQTLAKGALRSKSSYRGKLDIMFEGEFTYQPARKSSLHNLREVRVISTNEWLRRNLHALEQMAYATSLIEQNTEAETPLEGVYELFKEYLGYLERGSEPLLAVIFFEAKFLHLLGLSPDTARLSGSGQKLVTDLINRPFTDVSGPDKDAALECYRFLHGFIIYHCGKLPKNRPRL